MLALVAPSETLYRVTMKSTGETLMLTAAQLASIPARPAPLPSIRFLVNGLKVNGGKLQSARYSLSTKWKGGRALTVYFNSHCGRFSPEVAQVFPVENRTDSSSDYFEADRFDVAPSHPLFASVCAAMRASLEADARRHDAHAAKLVAKGQASRARLFTSYADSDRQRLADLAAYVAEVR